MAPDISGSFNACAVLRVWWAPLFVLTFVCAIAALLPQKADAARLWSSGAELQSAAANMEVGAAVFVTINTSIKHSGEASYRTNPSNSHGGVSMTFPGLVTTKMFFRTYVYIATMPSDDDVNFVSLRGTGDSEGTLVVNSNGTLDWRDDDQTIVDTGSTVLTTGRWYRIEIAYDAADSVEVKLDGNVELSVGAHDGDGLNEFSPYLCPDVIGLCGGDDLTTADFYFDDLAINDTSGAAQNDYPGAGSIVHINPDGSAGDNNDALSGNCASVDEQPTPDDGTTIAVLDDNNDILDCTGESSSSAGIAANKAITLLQVGIRKGAASSAVETWILRIKSASGGTTFEGTETSSNESAYETNGHLSAVIGIYTLTSYTDPTTGVAWTPTGANSLDNMQIGVRVTDADPDINVSTLWALVEYTDGTSRTTLSKPPNNLGLVGYWSFNEGTSTKATDVSGRGNTGTLNTFANPPTASSGWTNGKRGKALTFDGSSDYVELPSTVMDAQQDITIAAWVYPTAAGDYPAIACKTNLFDQGAAKYCFYLDGASLQPKLSEGGSFTFAGTALPLNTWTHVVVTNSASGDYALYENGIFNAADGALSAPGSSADTWKIGTWTAAQGFFPGKIDEIRIYNRALGPTEIAKLYGSGAVKFNASSVDLQRGSTLANGLVGHWTFDGPDATDKIYDRSGSNNHGYFNGGATSSAKVSGKLGQALTFDGVNDYVNVNNSASLTPTNKLTLSAWVKTTSTAQETVIAKWTGTNSYQLWLNRSGPNEIDFTLSGV